MTQHMHIDLIRCEARGHWDRLIAVILGKQYVTGKNGPCPGCGGTDRYQFNLRSESGAFSCRAHENGGGDGFDLIQHALDCDFITAAKHVQEALGLANGAGEYLPSHKPIPAPVAPVIDWAEKRERARSIWRSGNPITASDPAGMYLQSRGLPIPRHADTLRFHDRLFYYHDGKQMGAWPALIARCVSPEGKGVALHRVYLDHDGKKLSLGDGMAVKKIYKAGDLSGMAVRLSAPRDDRLAVSEGIENALAFETLTGIAAWSGVSACGLKSIAIPDGIKRVFIAADADEPGERAAQALAKRLVDGGLSVWINRPEGYRDWNDKLIGARQ